MALHFLANVLEQKIKNSDRAVTTSFFLKLQQLLAKKNYLRASKIQNFPGERPKQNA